MTEPRVSERIRCLASLVPPGARLIDVGCDHALLPIHFLLTRPDAAAVAVDNKEGPLRVAAQNVNDAGLTDRVTLVKAGGIPDGLLQAGDCVVIAGMGGVEMAEIIAAADAQADTYVLSPHSRAEVLRAALGALSLAIWLELVKCEAGRTYLVMTVKPASGVLPLSLDERWIGPHCLAQMDAGNRDPALVLYLTRLRRHLRLVLRHDPTVRSPLSRLEQYLEG